MKRGSTKGAWTLFWFLLAGVIIGSVVGDILSQYVNLPIFKQAIQIGTQGDPAWINFSVLRLAFGFTVTINFGTVLGVILGLIFYYRA